MDIQLNPYLFFRGNCREAMQFYKNIFGGKLTMQTVGESGVENSMGMDKNKIMHASLTGDVNLLASDSKKASSKASKVSLSLMGTDEARLRKIFKALSSGGKVFMPLKKQFWGDIFGSLTDKNGVEWMVNITPRKT